MSPRPRSRRTELFERSAQDDLLLMRNDLITVYREHSAQDQRLFPLRYARSAPRRGARIPPEEAPPQVPALIIPDGPGTASVLPYHLLRSTLGGHGLDVLMMEHRGVGLSRLDARGEDLPLSAMRVTEVVEDLRAVLDHAGVEQVAVLGSGYGAYLALALAARHPQRVHSLVLDSPRTSAEDERISQAALRAAYWDGEDPHTARTAASLRRLIEGEEVDAQRAGPIILAVHEHGGAESVQELVRLLEVGRGHLTWNSVRQVLTQGWLESTPYVVEHDLVAPISHTELGYGASADGEPLDALAITAQRARAVPPFAGEPWDLPVLAESITVPTIILSGTRDMITPAVIAQDLARRMPAAQLLSIPGAGHNLLDARSRIAQVALRWSAAGIGQRLPPLAPQLARLPVSPADRSVSRGLHIALAAERLSPWRLAMESARERRDRALVDPTARRTRTTRIR